MTTQTTSKEPVRLRRRTVSGGRQSLYLDIYIDGHRSYEYLKLYLIPERNGEDRRKNIQTLQLAEAVRAKRLVDLQNHRFGFESAYKTDTVFLDFVEQLCEERKKSQGNYGNWRSLKRHLEGYIGKRKLTFKDIDQAWVEGFRKYLDRDAAGLNRRAKDGTVSDIVPLSANSKTSYFSKLKAIFAAAVEQRIIPDSPAKGVKGFSPEDVEMPYLTLEELRKMAAAPCRYPGLKRAFLFSCLTGLRKSDILKLHWREVVREGGFTRIIFRQKKTRGMEYLDISPEAVEYMGEEGRPDGLVFGDFHYSSSSNTELRLWAARAGITKDISFHCGRHTFAVLMLDLGADIYTLQKLLGHRELRTTQVYADILDKKKQEAVARIPSILSKVGNC